MIYLHSYIGVEHTIHDFYNPIDDNIYSISIEQMYEYCIIHFDNTNYSHHTPIEIFEYVLPNDLYVIDLDNNRTRYEDLTDSKLRIALNNI